MDIRPIRTAADHRAALQELERIWDTATPGTKTGDKFEVLSTLVDVYEREHVAIPPPDPVEAIRFRMDQGGFTNKDLMLIFRTRARVSEVMSKRRRLNLAMIRKLHERFDIPFESLIQEYKLRAASGGSRQRRPASPRKRTSVAA